jgi:hypothetical protein
MQIGKYGFDLMLWNSSLRLRMKIMAMLDAIAVYDMLTTSNEIRIIFKVCILLCIYNEHIQFLPSTQQ